MHQSQLGEGLTKAVVIGGIVGGATAGLSVEGQATADAAHGMADEIFIKVRQKIT